ncbi:MerR family transcriptional regulator [Agromyces albus]|uniref:MerR family transcriptional regulator n=1 Tax=Agromyces albus TaxID=205332 RepID=UPI00277D4B7E|nr:MerR family transcriptional regulator [Agromyces albus]MDQ0574317.1 DNA-binding transcriptional MerR regulator [Agromyces albus]
MADEGDARGLTIAQMAAATGVSAHTLRYYERADLIHPVARNSGGQRRYSTADVEWVKFLLRLRETGMPIAQMREYAQLRALGTSTTAARLALLEAHQAALREQIAQLRAHEKALDTKIATYRDDLTALRADEHNQRGEADE